MEEPIETVAERLVKEALFGVRGSGNSEVKIELHDPEGARSKASRAWIAAGLSCIVAVFSAWVAADTKAEVRALRQEQQIQLLELRSDVKGIRAYINTGQLPPKQKVK